MKEDKPKRIIVLRGIPSSGKSTWAKEFIKEQNQKGDKSWLRLNRDSMRWMLNDYNFDQNAEKYISDMLDYMLLRALRKGYNIIVDNVNLRESYYKEISATAQKVGNVIVEEKFFDIPLKEAIERDSKRENPVGDIVIKSFWDRYIKSGHLRKFESEYIPKPEFKPIEPNFELPMAVICDLDGTLAIMGDRSPYDATECHLKDFVNDPVASIIKKLDNGYNGYKIIFVSGREEKYKEDTVKFIEDYCLIYGYDLHMRKTGDNRDDRVIKEEIYNEFIKDKYNVLGVFDDRMKVIRHWRKMGLFCFNVNQTEEEF